MRSAVQASVRRTPLAVAILAFLSLAAEQSVHASGSVFHVTSCGDNASDSTTLRYAALHADGSLGDSIDLTTISDFSACQSNQTEPGGAVAHVLAIGSTITFATGGVTVNGPGPSNLEVSAGDGNFRVFKSPGDLTINDLQIGHAEYSSSTAFRMLGGCVYAQEASVTLSDVRLTHCYVTDTFASGFASGGAVSAGYSSGHGVSLTNCIITRSKVTAGFGAYGGAVYGGGAISLSETHIYPAGGALGAYGGTYAFGGAVKTGAALTLSNSTIDGAKAVGMRASGGATFSTTSSDTITTSSITNSSVSGTSSAAGGCIYNLNGTSEVYLYASTVSGCTASSNGLARGGGVATLIGAIVARNSVFSNNSADIGGAIFVPYSGFAAYYSSFSGNHASVRGGAVYANVDNMLSFATKHDLLVRGSTIVGNTAGTCCSGLDLHAGTGYTATVIQSTTANNTGSYALYSKSPATAIYNSTIAFNTNPGNVSSGMQLVPIDATSTATIVSNLMSQDTFGSPVQNEDFNAASFVDLDGGVHGMKVSGDHNLIRQPVGGVPADTIVFTCPDLYPGEPTLINGVPQFPIRHEVRSAATNAGSNPLSLTADQRGGAEDATSPPRVSGPPGGTPLPDIGAYEIDQADIIFDSKFDACPN